MSDEQSTSPEQPERPEHEHAVRPGGAAHGQDGSVDGVTTSSRTSQPVG